MGYLRRLQLFRVALTGLTLATMLSCRAASFTTAGGTDGDGSPEGADDTTQGTSGNPVSSNSTAEPIPVTTAGSGSSASGNASGSTTPATTSSSGTLGTMTNFTTGSVAPAGSPATGTSPASSTPALQILANGQPTSISVAPSTAVTISWTASGVTACVVTPIAGSGLTGSMQVTPAATQIYTLTCQAGSGPVSANVTVLVVPTTPPTALITANGVPTTTTAAAGSSVAIAWSSQNATQCNVMPGNFSGLSGSQSIAMGNASVVYTLSCTGPGGTVTSAVTVNPPNSASLTATLAVNGSSSAISVPYGSMVAVTWSSTGAQACNLAPLNNTALQGTLTSAALTASLTYTLTCTGAGNSSVVVAVPVNVAGALPPTVSLTVNGSTGPVVIPAGQPETVAWTIGQATSCTLNPNIATISVSTPTGSVQQTAGSTAVIYSLSCTGPGGTTSTSVTVTPSVMTPTVTVTANGQTGVVGVPSGSDAAIAWTSSNTTACYTTPGNLMALNGNVAFGPINATAVFGVICTGPYGTAASSVTVVPNTTTTTSSGTTTTTTTETQTLTVNSSTSSITVMGNTPLTIAWTSSGATNCTVTPFNYTGTSGQYTTAPVTGALAVTLTCLGTSGGTTVTTIPVYVAPTTSSASVTLTGNGSTGPVYISTTNPNVELVWVSTGTTSCTFSDGTKVGPSGSRLVSVTSSTDYKLNCTTLSGSTISACLQINVANSCHPNSSMVGVNFTDTGSSGGSHNNVSGCLCKGDFSIYDSVIVSNREQLVPFTTSRWSSCSHNITINVLHPDGTQEPQISYNDANGTPSFKLHFHVGSILQVTMEPLDSCATGGAYTTSDSGWGLVRGDECVGY